MNFGIPGGMGSAVESYIATPEGQAAMKKFLASPDGIAMLKNFIGTAEGKKVIASILPRCWVDSTSSPVLLMRLLALSAGSEAPLSGLILVSVPGDSVNEQRENNKKMISFFNDFSVPSIIMGR